MKETPILFKPEMVRAILAGTKTQTRRSIKPQPIAPLSRIEHTNLWTYTCSDRDWKCPYGLKGDLLWVKEGFKYWDWTTDGMPWIKYKAGETVRFFDSTVPDDWADRLEDIWAKLSEESNYKISNFARDQKWRSPLFMPKWACRLWLELTADPKPQRVQEISYSDVIAEGLTWLLTDEQQTDGEHRRNGIMAFGNLWDSINGPGSWESNPWVWKLEFKIVEK